MAGLLLSRDAPVRDVQLDDRTSLGLNENNRTTRRHKYTGKRHMATLLNSIAEHWTVWFVTIVLIVAAVIDGKILKVPNWLTFPFIACGWMHWTIESGIQGLGWSLWGTFVGMMLLLVLRNVGGMGAGDVKLLAGVGAWLGAMITLKAFAATCIVGGIMAALDDLAKRSLGKALRDGSPNHSRMENRSKSKQIGRNRTGTQAKHVPASLWNPNGNRIDRLLRICWNADLIRGSETDQ